MRAEPLRAGIFRKCLHVRDPFPLLVVDLLAV